MVSPAYGPGEGVTEGEEVREGRGFSFAAVATVIGLGSAVGNGVGGTAAAQAASRNEPATAAAKYLGSPLAKGIALLLTAFEDPHRDNFGPSSHFTICIHLAGKTRFPALDLDHLSTQRDRAIIWRGLEVVHLDAGGCITVVWL